MFLQSEHSRQAGRPTGSRCRWLTLAAAVVVASGSAAQAQLPPRKRASDVQSVEPDGGQPTAANSTAKQNYPDMPAALTSFGAAVLGGRVYAYGGHTGEAHSYSNSEQSNALIALDLAHPTQWKTVARGPRLQGLALVAANGRLYRIGGFTAKNAKGEEQDLRSQAGVAAFDPAPGAWRKIAPLPEPRSSFDAAVLDGQIYVAGGWQLQGDKERLWHKTAWRLNPGAESPHWEALPEPPFQRRALALASHKGKLYAIGGMESNAEPTTRVDVFDPAASKWLRGPDLPGESMEGFGCSAFAVQGVLFVSTVSGALLRLADDGKSWEKVQQLETGRFFHRMLPIDDNTLIMMGGANMEIGKFDHVHVVKLKP